MNLSVVERGELKALSKEVFGRPNWWVKLYQKGALLPKGKLNEYGSSKRYFLTFDDLKTYMLELKAANERFLAEMKSKAAENALNEKNSTSTDPGSPS